MLDILPITSDDRIIQNDKGEEIFRNDNPLQPGDYVVSAEEIKVTDENVYTRAHSIATGPRVQSFTDAVRQRDGRCVVSKVEHPQIEEDDWTTFEAAHIFPLAYQSQWQQQNYGRWITIDAPQGDSINSVQNGILLRTNFHQQWDQYLFSTNPGNKYKIIYFRTDIDNINGNTLDRRLLDDPRRPPDALLRWHFRQAVLANMRGAGEPIYEHDFPSGSDIMGEILAGPKAAERIEFELFDRLAHHVAPED